MAIGDQKGEEEMQNNENDTVNMKCDLSHYLIAVNKTKLSVICEAEDKKLEQMMPEMEKKAQQLGDDQIIAIKNSIREPPLKHKDNNDNVTEKTESEQKLQQSSSRIKEKDQYQLQARLKVASSNFVQFAELVRLTQLESSIRQLVSPRCIRLRLVGGGEDSINNGTSAWGTPAATNNPTGSTWGPIGGGGGSAQQSNAAVGAPGGPQQQGAGVGVPPTTGAWGGAGQQNGPGPGGQTLKNNAPSGNPNSGAPEGSGSSGGNGGNGGAGGSWNGPGGNAQAPSASQGVPGAGVAGNGNNAGAGPQQDQQGVAAAVSQQQQVGAAAQVAGQPGQPDAGSAGASGSAAAAAGGAGGAVVQSSAAKNQLEHLNSLRESLFAQDGWGSENVDQDTLWEVPLSPEPGSKTDPNSATSGPMAGIPMWKTNTGTELWEANLRNGGQLPQQQPPVQKTPWGPANNYGGTWGEDDEANEPASGWNGSMGAAAGPGGPGVGMRDQPPGPQQSQQLAGQQQSQQPPWNSGGVGGAGVGAGAAGMWSGTGGGAPGGVGAMAPNVAAGLKKDNEWGSGIGAGAGAAGGSGAWGATGGGGGSAGGAGGAADGRVGGNPVAAGGLDPTGLDMRNIRIASAMDSNREIRGDPRGISGRLNGNVGLWDQHQMSSMQQKMPPTATTPGTPTGGVGGQGGSNQWPSNNPLGSVNNGVAGGVGGGAKLIAGSGWDDPNAGGGPPVVGGVRRNNMDDGTALWGQNALNRQNSGNVSGWNDNSGGGLGGPPGADGGMGRNLMHRNAMVGGGGNLPGNGGLVGRGVGPGGPMKPDSLWGQNPAAALGAGPRGGAGNWGADDVPSGAGGNNWGDEKPPGGGMGGNSLWNDGNNWNNKGKMSSGGGGGGGSGWNDGAPGGANSGPGGMDMGNSDWGMPPQSKLPPNGNKMNTLEIIRCSKPYRQLCDMGFKKEDVESVLRMTNMNVEESLEFLHRSSGGGGGGSDWSRRPDGGHGGFGAGDQFVGGGGVSGRFAAAAAGVGPMAFPQNNQNLGGGVFGGGNGSAAGGGSFNSMKFGGGAGHGGAGGNGGGPVGGGGPPGAGAGVFGGQQQQQQQQQPGALGSGGGGGGLNQSNAQSQQISNHHLRLLVQQIQLAVQNGYLENQILNQPLAPQTLMLLNQLLTHIKQLNVMQNNLSRTGGGGGVNAVQMSIAINKLKSQIASLQNQINMQQANYLKQQQQQQQHQQHQQQPPHPGSLNAANVNVSAIAAGGGGNHPGTDLFRGPSDLTGLPGSFAEMALKESGGVPFPSSGNTSQQSRLQKWKLPPNSASAGGLDKDASDLTDFVRAPGASSKSGPSGSGIDDGTWSNGRNNLGDGWPDSSSQDNKDWPGGNDAFSDLVPEFEPGKPWKGTQATRIEDDPTITPGSVARNPLSIAAAKESNLFGGGSGSGANNSKSSPTESPWSFNPSSGSVQGGNYGGKVQKNPWQDPNTPTMPPADLWETPLGGGGNGAKARGVGMMGGIGKAGAGGKMDTNGWNTPSTQASGSNTWNSGGPSANSWSSTWIMLKNLTAQIEGSTLRTLCLQHGPVINFQLFLNHGIALCKYGTREEAQKAQLALNNCQLGNTTICAEIPNESDIQYILPHLVGTSNGMANGLTGGGGQNWRLSAAAQSQPMVGRSNSVVQDTWSSNSWGTGNTSSNLWNTLDGGPGDRGTQASLNSLLPESLLGTELN
ncbi:protein Gawky-like [Anopheles marshallii]|uniref:protein Gawky-like n=1 Tax=Anopheles marshallii TaxID=1521116 RepID=UPI00237AEE93|nr:protein Gawky-like [Anopheles marshallii]